MGFLGIPSSLFKKKKKGSKSSPRKSPSFADATEAAATASVRSSNNDNELVLTKKDAVPTFAPEELRVVREWIRYKDAHDIAKMKELTSEDCYFTFSDSETEMPASEFYEAMKDIYASFPDLHFFWKSMSVQGTTTSATMNSSSGSHSGTVIVIKDYYGIGKHTGAPYFFGPYPPVETTGKTVRDEDIEFTFTVRDGKIVNATIYAFGEVVGPPGFYTKIGGVIMF